MTAARVEMRRVSQDNRWSGMSANDAVEGVAAPTNTLLSIRKIVKRYGNATAVNDICLDVREGELLTLLGPSGSGKTPKFEAE